MKKLVLLTITLLLSSSFLFAQIVVDGDNSDWANQPVLVTSPDYEEGDFPSEVGAITTDRVDVKEVKAVIQGQVLYNLITFQAGPVWPIDTYDGTRQRGYYKLVYDLDNDPATGWDTQYYEDHFTPVGYLISQGETLKSVGAELVINFGHDTEEHADSALHKIKYIDYNFQAITDPGVAGAGRPDDETIVGIDAASIDSSDSWGWQGATRAWGWAGHNGDSLRSFYFGHGWGEDCLELAGEITAVKEYFAANGMSYLQEGQTIAVGAFIETPLDGWGVEMTAGGEYIVPATRPRPPAINLAGDLSSWDAVPVLSESPDYEEGDFPSEVGAITSDRVDAKTLKAKIEGGAIYISLEFQGGPAWPNFGYEDRHRGYYHFMFDLDSDTSTGWNTLEYEGHLTPVGYLISQGEEILTVGRDFQVAFGIDTENDENPLQHVKYINYDMWDVGDFDYAKPDSASSFGTDGYGLDNGRLIWMGHAFAENTLIYGADWDAIVSYFDTTATPIGDQVTIAAFTETPIDGWGVDISHAGVLNLTTAIEKDKEFVANKFELGNNYPNPFNPTTSFTFSVPAKSNIQLNVYNAIGQKITTLVNKEMSSGKYTATWNGTNNVGAKVSSGLYFYELKADNFSSVKKMLLIK